MKISRYTFLFDVDNTEFYAYNTLSNALIELDEPPFRILAKAKTNRKVISECDLDMELGN